MRRILARSSLLLLLAACPPTCQHSPDGTLSGPAFSLESVLSAALQGKAARCYHGPGLPVDGLGVAVYALPPAECPDWYWFSEQVRLGLCWAELPPEAANGATVVFTRAGERGLACGPFHGAHGCAERSFAVVDTTPVLGGRVSVTLRHELSHVAHYLVGRQDRTHWLGRRFESSRCRPANTGSP